jgi:hypothetical protein
VAYRLSLAVCRVIDDHLGEDIRSLTDVHILFSFLGVIAHVDVKDFAIIVKNRLHHLVKSFEDFLVKEN